MRVAFVDAGVGNCGVAVMESHPTGIEAGKPMWNILELVLIETEANPRKRHLRASDVDLERFMDAMRKLLEVIDRHDIKRLAAEIPSGAQSAPAMKWLTYASALCGAVCVMRNLYFEQYSQGDIKKHVTGSAMGAKQDVAAAMERQFPQAIDLFPQKGRREHVLDALGVFVTAQATGNICKL